MFCEKCGKEIRDEAVICPNCGCATSNFAGRTAPMPVAVPVATKKQHSKEYEKVKEFESGVNRAFVFAVISLALSAGVGIILAIINSFSIKSLKEFPEIPLTDEDEIREYNQIKAKLKKTQTIHSIAAGIGGALLFLLFLLLMMSVQ